MMYRYLLLLSVCDQLYKTALNDRLVLQTSQHPSPNQSHPHYNQVQAWEYRAKQRQFSWLEEAPAFFWPPHTWQIPPWSFRPLCWPCHSIETISNYSEHYSEAAEAVGLGISRPLWSRHPLATISAENTRKKIRVIKTITFFTKRLTKT